MAGIRKGFGVRLPLVGLEDTLEQVAKGQLAPEEAARQIREMASRPRVSPLLVTGILILIGAVFFLVGLGFGAYSVLFARGAWQVEGTVIEMVGGHKQSPVVEYEVDGERYVLRSRFSTSPPAYAVGDKVPVIFRPANPAQAQINSFVHRWLFAVIFGSSGLGLVVLGLLWPVFIRLLTGAR